MLSFIPFICFGCLCPFIPFNSCLNVLSIYFTSTGTHFGTTPVVSQCAIQISKVATLPSVSLRPLIGEALDCPLPLELQPCLFAFH